MTTRRRTTPPPQPLMMPGETPPGMSKEAVDMLLNPPEEMPEELVPPPGQPRQEDRHPVDDAPPVGAEPLELSPEEQVMFASLLTCGRRSKTVTIFDHTVVVQTLCGDDDLRIGLYVKDYSNTLGEQRAYQIAVAAAGIRTINGKPLVPTLYEGADPDNMFDQKVTKVGQMYPFVISKIYAAVMDAEKEFVVLAERLKK